MILKPRLELLIATNNAGKIREIQETLCELPITLRYLAEFPNISVVEETGKTYEHNALLKALSYSEQTQICSLADDSGLEVDALGGIPGVLSARLGGEDASDHDRTEKLLQMLLPFRNQERSARFVCCMAFAGWPLSDATRAVVHPQILNISEGKCEGLIGPEPRGAGGFGYDPIFIPSCYEQTFGELPAGLKATLSHRAKALEAMGQFLSQFYGQLDPGLVAP